MVVLGFPFYTFGIITGAVWAQSAWGSYWNWDPKETWSLITWAIYAGYLHYRKISGWRGRMTNLFIVLGFLSVLVTFFAVGFFLPGLHSYF